jgi:hypothetical protein
VKYLLGREAPGFREYLVVEREEFCHAVQIAGEQVLAADFEHAWEVVDLLVAPHFTAKVDGHDGVRPTEVPLFGFTDHAEAQGSCSPCNDVVTAVDAHCQIGSGRRIIDLKIEK